MLKKKAAPARQKAFARGVAITGRPANIDACVKEGFPSFRDACGFYVLTNDATK